MPRVGGNGPMRRGAVFSNSSSDDEAVAVAAKGAAAGGLRADAPAWKGAPQQQAGQSMASLFEGYMAAGRALGDDLDKDQVFEAGLSRVRDCLAGVEASCCLICLNTIRPADAVWHCGRGCFTVLHLVCIQEWARSQLDAAAAKAAARLSSFPAAAQEARATAEWGCPKCRSMYAAAELPSAYTCFCGKATNPEFDPWVAPHSCGETCRRPLPGACGHECLLLCHPGPCPPCPLVVDAACHCGKQRSKRRCGHHAYGCEAVCGARLGCGHRCPDVCHPGDCAPCAVVVDLACRCGAQRRRGPCAERGFRCERTCGKALGCGNHACEQVCHDGPCGECPFAGVRTCPCGKVSYEGMLCTEKVPTCGGTCGKLLPCGVHRCADRCHHGDCTAQCRGPALKSCRCGRSQKEVLCFQEFTCERRCGEMRPCGRHPCKRRCCDGNCPPCEEVCGRRLKCGNHKCPAPCHSGPCRPCPLTVSVSCACGATARSLPCGAESSAEPPACSKPCSVPRTCRHGPALPPHRCHYGPCPPCTLSCATPLTCGHACGSSACHDPPAPPVADFQPPPPPKAPAPAAAAAAAAAGANGAAASNGGPAAGERERGKKGGGQANGGGGGGGAAPPPVAAAASLAAQMLMATAAAGELPSACPPCTAPVPVACVGAHGKRSMPCSEARPYSCGQACGRPLQCGNHSCALPCHAVAYGPVASAMAAAAANGGGGSPERPVPRPCRQCEARCDRPRGCAHPCPLACHRGPCPRCEAVARLACVCGKSTLQLPCHQLVAAAADPATAASVLSCGKPCHRQLPFCAHPCKALCHAGPCPNADGCLVDVTVRCGCPAKRRAKWRCAEVQAALVAAGRPRNYDDTQAQRLLPCDADCARAAKPKAAAAAPAATAAAAAPAAAGAEGAGAAVMARAGSAGAAAAAAAAAAAGSEVQGTGGALVPCAPGPGADKAGGGGGGRGGKLTRAEREAAAAAKEAERLRQERVSRVVRSVLLVVIVGLGVGLAWAARQMLLHLDALMAQRYALSAAAAAAKRGA